MRFMKPLLAAGAATALLASASAAQGATGQQYPNDYNHNWAPMHHSSFDVFMTGPFLFNPAPFGGSTGINYADFGDSTRRCWSIDITQGGRNQSTGGYGPNNPFTGQPIALPGVFETASMSFTGSYPQTNLPQFLHNNSGLITIRTASESDLNGDACFSPFFQSVAGQEQIAFATLGLTWGGSGYPYATQTVFHWTSSSAGFTGFTGPTTIGTSGPLLTPTLANLILERQGPTNGGPGNNQYWVGTTNERTGLGFLGGLGSWTGTGGRTNGFASIGSSIFGVTADLSGTVSHTRMSINDVPGGSLIWGNGIMQFAGSGTTELFDHLGFNTPGLWSTNDGDDGAGGPDWRASTTPLSIVDLRALDNSYGAKLDPAALAFDPCAGGLGFNIAVFLWSQQPATSMPQLPMSWDDLGFATGTVQPGSFLFGRLFTTEEGFQTVPANFDILTSTVLSITGLTLGTTFTPSQDAFVGDPNLNPLFQGNWAPIVDGVSTMSGGPVPPVGTAKPQYAGLRLGIAWVGVNLETIAGCPNQFVPQLTNVGNALTINMQ